MDRHWSTLGNILVVHNSTGNIVGYSSPDDLINTLITCTSGDGTSLIVSQIHIMNALTDLIEDDSIIYRSLDKNLFKQVYEEADTIYSRVLFIERAYDMLNSYLIYLVANRIDVESKCIMCDFGTLQKGGLLNETVGNCSKGAFYGIKIGKEYFKDIILKRLLTVEDKYEYEIENAKLMQKSSHVKTLANGQMIDLREQMEEVLILIGAIRLADKVINGEKIV